MARALSLAGALAAVALVLGACGDEGDGGAGLAAARPAASTGTNLAVTGTDGVRFDPDTLTVPAGRDVTLTFSAESGLEHNFVVEAGDESEGDLHLVHAGPGRTAEATFTIDGPGTYTVYCSVPGHREGGMVATLTVDDTG